MSNKLTEYLEAIKYEKDEKIIPENIKKGIRMLGIEGNFTSDANITEQEIISGKIAYAQGQRIEGTMPNNGILNYNPSDLEQNIPQGYVESGIVEAANITKLYEYACCLDIVNSILTGQQVLPYKELDYIEANKMQYLILTPLWANPSWTVETKISFDSFYNYQHLLSVDENDSYHESWVNSEGKYYVRFAAGNKQEVAQLQVETPYIITNKFESGYCATYVNGELKNNTYFGAFTSSNPIRFGRRSTGRFSGKIYYIKLYNGDVLENHLVPAINKDTDEICMYDLVTKTFFTNSGEEAFKRGALADKTIEGPKTQTELRQKLNTVLEEEPTNNATSPKVQDNILVFSGTEKIEGEVLIL